MITDKAAWPRLQNYVTDMVGAFADDKRVVVWDVYNEPGNSGMGDKSQPLMEAAFEWARAAKPTQPLTVGPWTDFNSPFSRRMMELSDVISFHGYDDRAGMEAKLKICAAPGRPVFCTEWLLRQGGNTFEAILPLFKERKIGCWHWGLVAGRTQTYFPWGSPRNAPEPALWQHDVLHRDGTPYKSREAALIRFVTGVSKTAPPEPMTIVPTAEKTAVSWRMTTEKPGDDWHKPGFDDAAWQTAPAPFGTLEPNIARQPRTPWHSPDIWLRREFKMPAGNFMDFALTAHFDENAEIYLDGVLAAKLPGFNAAYQSFPLNAAAAALLKPGKHLLAVQCRQTGGGQYFDAGLEATPAPETKR